MTHPWFAATSAPRVLAHRGLVTAVARETGVVDNSFAAIAAAHAAGATYVESDCHRTADGTIVLFHDDTLARTTGDPRRISEVTTPEIEELLSTRGGLITLQQALETFPTLAFNLDVKAEDAAAEVGRIVSAHADRVLVTSFSDRRRRRALAAAGHPGPATSAGSTTILKLLVAVALRSRRLAAHVLRDVDAVQIPERQGPVRILSPRLIATVHALGIEVHVWTVNDAADMRRLLSLGIDGLVTDHADVALDVVRTSRIADA